MGKKLKAALISALLCLAIFGIIDTSFNIIDNVSGEIFYVNKTGSGGVFTSIQDAINASSDGDTVFVYNGTYYENVVINKTINLTGEDKDTTIIDGDWIGDVVRITVHWVNITGFTVTGSGSSSGNAGIELDNVQNCSLIDNNISSNVGDGIFLINSSKNLIINNTASDNDYGIYLYNSSRNMIVNNIILYNGRGILLRYSARNNITSNNASLNNGDGIHIGFSNENYISSNDVSNNRVGIRLDSSSLNNLTDNEMIENGIYFAGDLIEHWNTHEIDISNTVNGKPLYYWKNKTNDIIPSGAGQIILANCTNIKVWDQEGNNASVGIQLGFSSNNSIYNNNASSNKLVGILLWYSNSNNITFNNASSNYYNGISLSYSSNNNISNNAVYFSNWEGINLYHSDENIIIDNMVFSNNHGIGLIYSKQNNIIGNNASNKWYNGIYLRYSDKNNVNCNVASDNLAGIQLSHSNYNNITGNSVYSNNTYGISLSNSNENNIIFNNASRNKYGSHLSHSDFNSFIGNNFSSNYDYGIFLYSSRWNNIMDNNSFSNNTWGVYLEDSSTNRIIGNKVFLNSNYGFYLWISENNIIYHNDIIDNTNQSYDTSVFGNKWDDGYPSGGNFWSDYGGVDLYKGPNQNIPGSDGIGDTPYNIGGIGGEKDEYPLMGPYNLLENYTILKQGWNLISIPLTQEEQNLTRVLGSIDGWYDAAQWYDNTDPTDPWKHHKVGKPFGNDLFEINESMGFWVHITQPGDTIFLYNGTQSTVNQTITIYPGWNLVGYPSLTSYNRSKGLNNLTFDTHVDSIWTYYAATQKWKELGPLDYFELGQGYWIHARVKCEWEVPL